MVNINLTLKEYAMLHYIFKKHGYVHNETLKEDLDDLFKYITMKDAFMISNLVDYDLAEILLKFIALREEEMTNGNK